MLRRTSIGLAFVLSLLILSGCNSLFHEKKGGGETAYALEQTDDGGYILAGRRDLDDVRYSAALTKTDAGGSEEWSQVFEINGSDMRAYSVQQTRDGGYILAGIIEDATYDDAFLIKTDARGNEEWSQVFGGSLHDHAYSVQQTRDGGFIMAGHTWSYGDGHYDTWLLKTDPLGNEEWSQVFEGDKSHARSVQQAEDEGYIIAGGWGNAWLLKTDALGNEEWSQVFEDTRGANSVQQTQDGGFIAILSGPPFAYYGRTDLWLLKTDALGNEEWLQVFDASKSEHARSVRQASDGGYIIAGGWGNAWLLKTDPLGNEEWLHYYGGSDDDDYGSSVQQARDEGFVLAGYSRPRDGTPPNAWLIKVGEGGNEEWSQAFGDEYVVGYGADPRLQLVVGLTLAFLIFNLVYFLLFSSDMKRREEKRWAWLLKFLILGPLAAAWYVSYRKHKDGEVTGGNKIYHLAKNFILHWTIFLWLFPVSVLVVTILLVGPGYMFVGMLAMLLGVGFLFIFVWLALWLVPVTVSAIIMLAAKFQGVSRNP